jgi:hypothetical protein
MPKHPTLPISATVSTVVMTVKSCVTPTALAISALQYPLSKTTLAQFTTASQLVPNDPWIWAASVSTSVLVTKK